MTLRIDLLIVSAWRPVATSNGPYRKTVDSARLLCLNAAARAFRVVENGAVIAVAYREGQRMRWVEGNRDFR